MRRKEVPAAFYHTNAEKGGFVVYEHDGEKEESGP